MPAPKGNQYAKGNKGGGRPTLYTPEAIKLAAAMAKLGAIDEEIAEEIGVSISTFRSWKLRHEELSDVLKKGKERADQRVEDALYSRALGYSHPDVDLRVIEGQIVQTPIIKHYPPDTGACIFWLKNRRPDQWREKRDPEGSEDLSRAIEIIRAVKPDEDRSN